MPVPLVTTQAMLGFRVPSLFHAATLSSISKTFRSALANPNWRATMEEEHAALLKNHTWDLVPRSPRANMVSGKWIFKHKFHSHVGGAAPQTRGRRRRAHHCSDRAAPHGKGGRDEEPARVAKEGR